MVQVEEMVSKALSDDRAREGRLRKSAVEKEAEGLRAEIVRIREEKDNAELEQVRDDPDRLAQFRRRQRLDAREQDMLRQDQDLQEREKGMREATAVVERFNREQDAHRIGAKYGVEASDILSVLQLKDGSPEQMEALAKVLVLRPPGEGPTLRPVSRAGSTSGPGVRRVTRAEIRKMSAGEYQEMVREGKVSFTDR
ncbi:MAG: hypothetical protein V3S82_07265 [Dehalococcoidia bacterium]